MSNFAIYILGKEMTMMSNTLIKSYHL